MDYKFIKSSVEEAVGLITLNRPEVMNALNLEMMDEIAAEMERMDEDPSVRVIVLTGNRRAFAAGADIGEMADDTAISMFLKDQFTVWDRIALIKKPVIAAVSGFALGGGCELMMHCDMVIASETARIGQPEVKLGVMPGAGGSVRLTKAVGKVKAMEMLMTGEPITAEEALRYGLVNRVVPEEVYLQEAMKLARRLAQQPPVALRLIKKSVLRALDAPTFDALQYERNAFYLLFASDDQKEGMKAFTEKRKAKFTGK